MNFLYLIIISPIETIVDWVFNFILNKFGSFGVIGAVFGVSLAINFLALPLYNVADSLQEKERRIAKSLEHRVGRIKKAFKGDERFMMLSTYYRLNNYHPLYVLRSSLSILIEIPFFIAAYHYLSHNEFLRGASWWIFSDLGSPDTFFSVGNFQIHVLPILMTAINFVSGAIYTKDAPFREKIQLYGIAFVFLFLLYNSPSGLVIYWILNNIFSLVKNIVMRMRNPLRILHIAVSSILILGALYYCTKNISLVKKAAVSGIAIFVALIPLIKSLFNKLNLQRFAVSSENKNNFLLLVFSGLGLCLLCGLVLPANIISTSPSEFSFLGNTENPLSFVYSSFFVFFGFFVFWPVAIYKMFGKNVRRIEPVLFFIFLLCGFLNVFVLKADYGTLNISFTLDRQNVLSSNLLKYLIFSFAAFIFSALIYFAASKFSKMKLLNLFIFAVCLAQIFFGLVKIRFINEEFVRVSNIKADSKITEKIEPFYNLSKTEKNVVVIFLDKAMSCFFPYIVEQFPELKDQYKGFTYFPNTLSFSTGTLWAEPAMAGGYDFSTEKLNEPASELLRDKHDKANLFVPKNFLDAGYSVTISDPAAPTYIWRGELAVFKKYPGIKVQEFYDKFTERYLNEKNIISGINIKIADKICRKEIVNFSILQAMLPAARRIFYSTCSLNHDSNTDTVIPTYSALYYLNELTDFSAKINTWTFIANDTTHEPSFFDSPDFDVPGETFMNTTGKFITNDKKLISYYHANVAAIKKIGKWLDYLKENSAYDNTRVIIVADHGSFMNIPEFGNWKDSTLPVAFNPLLLMKDFSSSDELKTDNSFMTNADVPYFEFKDLNLPVSEKINLESSINNKKNGVTVWVCPESDHNPTLMFLKKQFALDKTQAWHVSENIFDEKNWIPLLEWEKSH